MSTKQRVALFTTCIVDQIMPEVGVATLRLLRRAGYEVIYPAEQTCCGQPFFNSGFRQQALPLARRTVDIFADFDAVVLPSGSCTTMIRKEYVHLLQEEPRYLYRARRLASKTFELSEFLVKEAGWEPPEAEEKATVTYHDSCHMCRMLGLGSEPRLLLRQAGCEIEEMSESDRCCGFGGVFSIRMPEVSNAMTTEKLRQATETAAGALVTADPGCLMQMRGMAGAKEGAGQEMIEPERLRHLAVVLEEMTR